jgi:hypothetical protein
MWKLSESREIFSPRGKMGIVDKVLLLVARFSLSATKTDFGVDLVICLKML